MSTSVTVGVTLLQDELYFSHTRNNSVGSLCCCEFAARNERLKRNLCRFRKLQEAESSVTLLLFLSD